MGNKVQKNSVRQIRREVGREIGKEDMKESGRMFERD